MVKNKVVLRDRVQEHGEAFTAEEVNAMVDFIVKLETMPLERTFLSLGIRENNSYLIEVEN